MTDSQIRLSVLNDCLDICKSWLNRSNATDDQKLGVNSVAADIQFRILQFTPAQGERSEGQID